MDWTPAQLDMYREETFGTPKWISTCCGCRVWVVGERVRVVPCTYDCTVWAWRVGVPLVVARCEQKMRVVPRESYKGVLEEYLAWGKGGTLGFGCEIGSYMHGKASREWHVKEWKQGVEDGLFRREEFLGVLGCTRENFVGIFGREPNDAMVAHLSTFAEEGSGEVV